MTESKRREGEGKEKGTYCASVADGSGEPPPAKTRKPRAAKTPKTEPPTNPVWDAYAAAYEGRYEVAPLRNAQANGMLSKFLGMLPAEEAPHVAAFFVGHNGPLYCAAGHALNLLVRDAPKLRTEWITGRTFNAKPNGNHAPFATAKERDTDAASAEVRQWTGPNGVAARPAKAPDFFEMETMHGPQLAIR